MRFRSTSLLATLALAVVACVSGDTTPVGPLALPFVEDDWTGALSQARARQVPLFVEAWAPW